ncbi:MAG: DUF1571 domain-containing protein [Planctomycetota bacterium]
MQRREFIALLGTLASAAAAETVSAKSPKLVEPVHRVEPDARIATASVAPTPINNPKPLDDALVRAKKSLLDCRTTVQDYTALLVKRERVDGVLGPHEYMSAKIRCRKVVNGQLAQPLSVYLAFIKPAAVRGREVLYVEGQNNNKLIAHEGGLKGRFLPTVKLPPTGSLAMKGQRYPMTDIGIENMLVKLIQRGEQARALPDVQSELGTATINKRPCSVLTVTQPTKRPELLFYQAKVYMDNELNIPIRYIAYDWPKQPNAPLEVLEEYNYLNVKLNVGLTDKDFDPNNSKYNFY